MNSNHRLVPIRWQQRPQRRGSRGISLVELVLAVTILAVSFLPVIGVMGTSIKATAKDELVVKAIHLAQTRMNVALQFPFGSIAQLSGQAPTGSAPNRRWTFGMSDSTQFQVATNSLTLRLGPVWLDTSLNADPSFQSNAFRTRLIIEEQPLQFGRMQTYDVTARNQPANWTAPANWSWSVLTNYPATPMADQYQKYTLIVLWNDVTGASRFYSMVAFKARLME